MSKPTESALEVLFLRRWREGFSLSNDGQRYYAMGRGEKVCFPFQFRWLVPTICKNVPFRWRMMSDLSTLGLIPAMAFVLFSAGATLPAILAGSLCVIGLRGVFNMNRRYPALVDAPAMLFTLISYGCFLQGWHEAFIALAVLAGCVKETSFLYLLGLTLSPWALTGLLSPVVRKLMGAGPDPLGPDMPGITRPYSSAIQNQRWGDPKAMILPWGGLLTALFYPTPSLLLSLALAYGPLIRVTDTQRVYQWAWMAMVVTAFTNLPDFACIFTSLITIYNPKR